MYVLRWVGEVRDGMEGCTRSRMGGVLARGRDGRYRPFFVSCSVIRNTVDFNSIINYSIALAVLGTE